MVWLVVHRAGAHWFRPDFHGGLLLLASQYETVYSDYHPFNNFQRIVGSFLPLPWVWSKFYMNSATV